MRRSLVALVLPCGLTARWGKTIARFYTWCNRREPVLPHHDDAYAQVRKQGGKPSETDPNVWFIGEGKERITIGMWVDDMLILTPKGRRDLADKFWNEFRKRFNCKDLVVPAKFVGLEIQRNRAARTITLRQSTYIDGMFDKYMSGDHTKVRGRTYGWGRDAYCRESMLYRMLVARMLACGCC